MSTQQDKPYKYGVTAYNQGFYKFGPMEQCATGEWVRWNDIEPVLRATNLRVQTAMETEQELSGEVEYQTNRVSIWEEDYYARMDSLQELQKSLDTWRALCIGMAVAFLVVAIVNAVKYGA